MDSMVWRNVLRNCLGITTLSNNAGVRAQIRCHTPAREWAHDRDEGAQGAGQALPQGHDPGSGLWNIWTKCNGLGCS